MKINDKDIEIRQVIFVCPADVRPGDERLTGPARQAIVKLYSKLARQLRAPVDQLFREMVREEWQWLRWWTKCVPDGPVDKPYTLRTKSRRAIRIAKGKIAIEIKLYSPNWKRTVAISRPVW